MALTKSDKTWVKGVLKETLGSQEQKYESKIGKVEAKFETKIDQVEAKFETKIDQVEAKFEAKIDEFKDDFYTKIDPILKEVVASREERTILSQHSKEQSDRIERVEKKLNLQAI